MDVSSCPGAADALIAAVGRDREMSVDLLRRYLRRRVLRAVEVSKNDEISSSFEELLDTHARRQLFRSTVPKDRVALTKELTRAAPGPSC